MQTCLATLKNYYLYTLDGIIGYEENGERFLYRKNLFGDITAIYKGATKAAGYKYDAWGNYTIIKNKRNGENPFLIFIVLNEIGNIEHELFGFCPTDAGVGD